VSDDVYFSSRGEYVEYNPVPQIQTVSWSLVWMSVVLPQLCAEVNEVKHGIKASCPLLTSQAHLLLQRALDKLHDRGVACWGGRKTAATYVRSGQYHLILYLLTSRPPPTRGEVLPVLNDGRQTRLGVAVSAVDRMSNLAHEVLRCFEAVQCASRSCRS